MEHHEMRELASQRGMALNGSQAQKLAAYCTMVFKAGNRFNLTGFNGEKEIAGRLILDSIAPLMRINVPRGTLFADMGAGAGVPGVPAGVIFEESRGVLFDSSEKRVMFVRQVLKKLSLDNLSVVSTRLETAGRDPEYRDMFDMVLSRAFGPLLMSLELGSPLMKTAGMLHVYSHGSIESLSEAEREHAERMKLAPVSLAEGLLSFVKKGALGPLYPRRYAVIKREADRHSG